VTSTLDRAPELVEVALALPVFRTFTYAVGASPHPRHPLVPGARVVVPFRGRREIGVCLGTRGAAPEGVTVKSILDVPDEQPALSPDIVELCRWIADYYAAPIGVALRCALPALLTGAARPSPAPKTRRMAIVRTGELSLLERDRTFARAARQRAAYELLESLGGRAAAQVLLEQLRCSPSVLKALAARGLIDLTDEDVDRDPFASRARSVAPAHDPTAAQRNAIDTLTAASPGEVILLHGITGSGKTLVYLEFLREVVDVRGRGAIVLVPEIALTPQTVDRFRAVFGDRVAVLHSALGEGERYDAWRALRSGAKRIVVGARSAVFAPVAELGAIIVDEEHEGSYKNGESPRYHAREAAVVRARLAGAVAVLGSATPSLETWANASRHKYRYVSLPSRVGGGRLPSIEVVDLRQQDGRADAEHAPQRGVLSERLERELGAALARGEQAIVLLNRRGYAAFVQCSACGDVAACPHCAISLTYHRTPERLVCHYCQHQEPPRTTCRRCGGATLRRRGMGTQQVERLLAERFPRARIARMDFDTTSGKWSHAAILDRVASGDIDLLLGTQMIAKGLDFPNVTLVGVIDADVGINLPDFRASERCFQLLSQVAGRAGRGPKGGRVIIQTRVPAHHAVRCAVAHDYAAFVKSELDGRAHPAYPPCVRLANIVVSGHTEDATASCANEVADWVRRLVEARNLAGVSIVGPAPCPVERVKNRWRWHVLLKGERPVPLTRVAQYFVRRFPVSSGHGLRVMVDRDPVALL
jgi:primosomal protein N' (replication factor Y) (superfamily II helicase)